MPQAGRRRIPKRPPDTQPAGCCVSPLPFLFFFCPAGARPLIACSPPLAARRDSWGRDPAARPTAVTLSVPLPRFRRSATRAQPSSAPNKNPRWPEVTGALHFRPFETHATVGRVSVAPDTAVDAAGPRVSVLVLSANQAWHFTRRQESPARTSTSSPLDSQYPD